MHFDDHGNLLWVDGDDLPDYDNDSNDARIARARRDLGLDEDYADVGGEAGEA